MCIFRVRNIAIRNVRTQDQYCYTELTNTIHIMITCVLANTIHMRLLSEHIYNLIIEYYFMCILSLISISTIHIYYILNYYVIF